VDDRKDLREERVDILDEDIDLPERIDSLEYVTGQTLEPLIRPATTTSATWPTSRPGSTRSSWWTPTPSRRWSASGDEGLCITWTIHTFYKFYWVLRRVQDYLLDFYDVPDLMRQVLATAQQVNARSRDLGAGTEAST
jgi:hypothetical protein